MLAPILYEMVTAERPFRGNSTSEVLNAILNVDPIEMPEAGGRFDAGLARLLRRCLEKNPNERVQSALDLAFDLEALLLPNERAQQESARAAVEKTRHRTWAGGRSRAPRRVLRRPRTGERTAASTPRFRRLTYRRA